MKKRILIIILSLATFLGSALYVAAAPSGGPGNGRCDGCCDGPRAGKEGPGVRFIERMTRTLELTEAQQASIKKMQAAEQEKIAALHEKKQENRQQLRQAEGVKPFDENAVRSLAEERGAIEAELTVARARMHSQIAALLTPEQQELAGKLRHEPGEKRKGGRRCR